MGVSASRVHTGWSQCVFVLGAVWVRSGRHHRVHCVQLWGWCLSADAVPTAGKVMCTVAMNVLCTVLLVGPPLPTNCSIRHCCRLQPCQHCTDVTRLFVRFRPTKEKDFPGDIWEFYRPYQLSLRQRQRAVVRVKFLFTRQHFFSRLFHQTNWPVINSLPPKAVPTAVQTELSHNNLMLRAWGWRRGGGGGGGSSVFLALKFQLT